MLGAQKMPIVLLTDFGNSDGYAGILRGVLAQWAPKTPVIDLAHEIPPYDVVQAGLILYQAYSFFPKGSIFVAVVDPGVGSARRPLLVKTQDYYFIGPDNGLFNLALFEQKIEKIIELTNPDYFLKKVSSTFHGRDIFAPVAAHLSMGTPLQHFGPELSHIQKLAEFTPEEKKGAILGRILSIDRFGNLITNLRRAYLLERFPNLAFQVTVKNKTLRDLKTHYAQGEKKKPFLVFGSSNLLEIAVNQGSAAGLLQLKRKDTLRVRGR